MKKDLLIILISFIGGGVFILNIIKHNYQEKQLQKNEIETLEREFLENHKNIQEEQEIKLVTFPYSISDKGKIFIKENEGCSLLAYPDAGGWSIGYGHHRKDVTQGMIITKEKAEKLFEEDIKKINISINNLLSDLPVKHNFSQDFIDGLGDLVYNCGENGVRQSEFYERLKKCRKNNDNDFNYTISAVKTCRISSKNHIERRYKTHLIMLKWRS